MKRGAVAAVLLLLLMCSVAVFGSDEGCVPTDEYRAGFEAATSEYSA